MNIRHVSSGGDVNQSAAVITYYSGGTLEDIVATLDGLQPNGLTESWQREELEGGTYAKTLLHGPPAVMLVGLGKRADDSDIRWKRAVEAGVRGLIKAGYRSIAVVVPQTMPRALGVRSAVEAASRATYGPDILKSSDKEDRRIEELIIISRHPVEDAQLREAAILGEGINLARDLLNRPPSELNPVVFAERVSEIGREAGFKVEILNEKQIENMGMGAILAVAKGSDQPARVMKLECGDPSADAKLTFVGKGLTYDSGGLSLKTHEGLEWMKGDMGGAAAVVGAMYVLSQLKPSGVFLRGVIGAVENMTGPAAMKPGDVLHTMKGKTIEVLNTDAEGRLVLSDVLALAVRDGATHIVDLATLTGAAQVALGNEAAALIGRPQEWIDTVKHAADEANERVWQLPLFPEYRRQISSDVADMKNTGGRPGGALTAAALLAEFVDDVPWAHLDIAGTAWIEKAGYSASGGTGFGVATLVELAKRVGSKGS
jgi:leucyl aminopeptidase